MTEVERAKSAGSFSVLRAANSVNDDTDLSRFQRMFYYGGTTLVTGLVVLIIAFTALFIISPDKTARWFDINSTSTTSDAGFLGRLLKPVGALSLQVVRIVSPTTYQSVLVDNAITDVTDFFTVDADGNIKSYYNLTFPNSSYLVIPDTTMIENLNAEMVQGKVPGANLGDLVSWTSAHSIDGLRINSANIADGTINQIKLATISETGKVAGSAVQLSPQGGLTDQDGLSLKTDCNTGEILNWTGSAWTCVSQNQSESTKILATNPLTYDSASGVLLLDVAKVNSWDLSYLHISDLDNPHSVTANQVLPSQAGQNGKVLGTTGSNAAWITNSSNVAWGAVTGILTDQSDLIGALATKEPTITAGVNTQYYRGDKTWAALDAAAVGLTNVDNTADANKPISTATATALTGKQDSSSGLSSISGLSYSSPSFVKMTGANTFALDLNTYLTSLDGAILADQTAPQTIGLTGSRLAQLWATNIDATSSLIKSNSAIDANAVIVTEGDSITFGYGLSPGEPWPEVLVTQSSFNGRTLHNEAISGSEVSTLVARYSTAVHPYAPTGNNRAILMVMVGTNDFSHNHSTGADVYAALSSYWETAKADGFEVWALTVIGRGFTAADQVQSQILNSLIRQSSIPDRVIDVAQILANPLDTDLFQDGSHPTATGARMIAQMVNKAGETGLWPALSSPNYLSTNKLFAASAVGVGVYNPAEALDVLGNFKITGNFVSTVAFSQAIGSINMDTLDASDTKMLRIGGGGSYGYSRGASIELVGNESGTTPGQLSLIAGNVGTAPIAFYVGGQNRMTLTSAGHLTIEGVTSTGATGTGNLVFSADPTLSGVTSYGTLSGGGITSSATSSFKVTLSPPGAPTGTPSTSGGLMDDGTYYYVITALDSGQQNYTTKGTESSAVVISGGGGTGSVALSWTAVQGAVGYRVYRTTTPGTYGASSLVGTVTQGLTTFTDTLNAGTSGIPPATNLAYATKIGSTETSWVGNGLSIRGYIPSSANGAVWAVPLYAHTSNWNGFTFNPIQTVSTTAASKNAMLLGLTLSPGVAATGGYSDLRIQNATLGAGASLDTHYGLRFDAFTGATNNYPIYFAGTGAGNGLTWGTDSPLANLYKSTTSTLKTDGSLVVDTALTVNGNTTLGNASTDTITNTGRLLFRTVTDAGPMTATAGTQAEVVFNTSDSSFYGCTVTHATAATWVKLN